MSENEPIGNADWLDQLHPHLRAADYLDCEFKGCRSKATLYFQLRCCNTVFIMCREHTGQMLFFTKLQTELGKVLVCKHCSLEIDSIDFVTAPQPLMEQS